MPYYSVRITGGSNCNVAGLDAREVFGGRRADYTGQANFFYVQKNYSIDVLRRNIESYVNNEYKTEVAEIDEEEYNWATAQS